MTDKDAPKLFEALCIELHKLQSNRHKCGANQSTGIIVHDIEFYIIRKYMYLNYITGLHYYPHHLTEHVTISLGDVFNNMSNSWYKITSSGEKHVFDIYPWMKKERHGDYIYDLKWTW